MIIEISDNWKQEYIDRYEKPDINILILNKNIAIIDDFINNFSKQKKIEYNIDQK